MAAPHQGFSDSKNKLSPALMWDRIIADHPRRNHDNHRHHRTQTVFLPVAMTQAIAISGNCKKEKGKSQESLDSIGRQDPTRHHTPAKLRVFSPNVLTRRLA